MSCTFCDPNLYRHGPCPPEGIKPREPCLHLLGADFLCSAPPPFHVLALSLNSLLGHSAEVLNPCGEKSRASFLTTFLGPAVAPDSPQASRRVFGVSVSLTGHPRAAGQWSQWALLLLSPNLPDRLPRGPPGLHIGKPVCGSTYQTSGNVTQAKPRPSGDHRENDPT